MLFETLLRVTHVCGGCLLGSGALGLSRVGQLAGEGGRGRGGRMSWWETRVRVFDWRGDSDWVEGGCLAGAVFCFRRGFVKRFFTSACPLRLDGKSEKYTAELGYLNRQCSRA